MLELTGHLRANDTGVIRRAGQIRRFDTASAKSRHTRVGFDLKCMVLAIDLDDELLLHAGEVGEVRTDRMLTSELAANELAIAKQAPNQTFGIACLVPQLSRFFCSGLRHDPTSP